MPMSHEQDITQPNQTVDEFHVCKPTFQEYPRIEEAPWQLSWNKLKQRIYGTVATEHPGSVEMSAPAPFGSEKVSALY